MRVLTKGYWNLLAGAKENPEKPTENYFFPVRYKFEEQPRSGKTCLRAVNRQPWFPRGRLVETATSKKQNAPRKSKETQHQQQFKRHTTMTQPIA